MLTAAQKTFLITLSLISKTNCCKKNFLKNIKRICVFLNCLLASWYTISSRVPSLLAKKHKGKLLKTAAVDPLDAHQELNTKKTRDRN